MEQGWKQREQSEAIAVNQLLSCDLVRVVPKERVRSVENLDRFSRYNQ